MPSNGNPTLESQGFMNNTFLPLPRINSQGYNPKDMFSNHNFNNRGDLLNNNLNSILLNEEIREYSVMIDSKDRNYHIYPNPFSYEVKFAPLPKSRSRISGREVVYDEPSPTINDNFVNVRYIKLDTAILPIYNSTKMNHQVNQTHVDHNRTLNDLLYVVLSIGDYNDNNYRSTNDVLSDSFAVIYNDGNVSDTHYRGVTTNGIKIFQQINWQKIDKLKINFMDPYGKLLNCTHLNKNVTTNYECQCNDINEPESSCYYHNIFHPLNPLFQHHLQFKIGVVEPRLNKLTFY